MPPVIIIFIIITFGSRHVKGSRKKTLKFLTYGIQPHDVGLVILSGIWNSVIPFEKITRSLFPLAKYKTFEAIDLNLNSAVSKINYLHISPCLSTAWCLTYGTENKLITDRFIPFPYQSEGVFSFTPSEDDIYLSLFALPLDSTKQINMI